MKRRLVKLLDRCNPVMVRILTSRAHRLLSAGLCVIEYQGRRSGTTFRLPAGYHDMDETIIVSTSLAPERHWWRNFVDGHPARLCVKGSWRTVHGRVLEPGSDEYRRFVEAIFSRGRIVVAAMGVEFDPAVGLTDEAVRTLAETSCVTRFDQ